MASGRAIMRLAPSAALAAILAPSAARWGFGGLGGAGGDSGTFGGALGIWRPELRF